MNGVEILSSAEVGVNYTSNWWLAGFIWIAIIFVGGLIGFLLDDIDRFEAALAGSLIGAAVGILVWLVVAGFGYHPN